NDTNHTNISIAGVAFYPSGNVQGSGCAAAVTVLPLCGLKGVKYLGATSLAQNYPNPFAGMTTIHVTCAQSDTAGARLRVYNMLGSMVADLTSQLRPDSDVSFNAAGLPQGVYYYVLEAPNERLVRQMFVMR
ncbi:MAG TPA: T9SS type A sorting domain-containing protein, partial [Candidatus Kapabacteria bacterium]|nr:T9SS type A sorting domain-containing protein [Candidatus Kapabacteria bacterium]